MRFISLRRSRRLLSVTEPTSRIPSGDQNSSIRYRSAAGIGQRLCRTTAAVKRADAAVSGSRAERLPTSVRVIHVLRVSNDGQASPDRRSNSP